MPATLAQKLSAALFSAVSFTGTCFRNVSLHYATQQDVLSAQGSLLTGGRFNFRGAFGALYLSCDVHTCIEETTRSFRQAGVDVARVLPRALIGVEVRLMCVLDLTDARTRRQVNVTRSLLVETDWEQVQEGQGREAVTQELGRLARAAGFEAMLVPSAAMHGRRNLVVFTDNLQPSSSLTIINSGLLPPV